jgi:hypothetical protein
MNPSVIGWDPMSVDQGFRAGDNIVTINSRTCADSVFSIGADTAAEVLDRLAARLVDIQLILFRVTYSGSRVRPQLLLSPCLAEAIAARGYSKARMRQYLYEHATFPAIRFERLRPDVGSLCDGVTRGKLPKHYCESSDPNRLVPLLLSPDDLMITVSGDPDRDNCFVCAQNGFIGYPVSKRIRLPVRWRELLRESDAAYDNRSTYAEGVDD